MVFVVDVKGFATDFMSLAAGLLGFESVLKIILLIFFF